MTNLIRVSWLTGFGKFCPSDNPAPCPPPVWVGSLSRRTTWHERAEHEHYNSARHRCFMMSPNADEKGSLDANSYEGGHVFLPARTYE